MVHGPPPPPRQQPPAPGPSFIPSLQPDVLPHGISRFPPPDMKPPLPVTGLPGQAPPPGMMVPLIRRPPIWSSTWASSNDETATSTWSSSKLTGRGSYGN